MTDDDELGYPAEDFKSIPKDTKIFIIFDPQDMDSYAARNKTADQLTLAGFTNIHNHSVAYYGKILDGSYGIDLQISSDAARHYDDRAIRKMLLKNYTHTLLLRKIRTLKKQVIVLEAGVVFRSRTIDGKPHYNFIDRELVNFNFEPIVHGVDEDGIDTYDISAGYWISPKKALQLVDYITGTCGGVFTRLLETMYIDLHYNEVMRQRESFEVPQDYNNIQSKYTIFIRED